MSLTRPHQANLLNLLPQQLRMNPVKFLAVRTLSTLSDLHLIISDGRLEQQHNLTSELTTELSHVNPRRSKIMTIGIRPIRACLKGSLSAKMSQTLSSDAQIGKKHRFAELCV